MFSKKKLVLNVLLNPQVKNNFEMGLGYSIDSGPRTKIVWKKPWVNMFGHSLESNFNLSTLEQFIDFNYKIPLISNPISQYYLLQGGLVRNNISYFPSSIFTMNISRCWNYTNNWRYSISLYWYFTDRDVKKQKFTKVINTLVYPGMSVSRVRQRGGVIPYWGDSQRYSIGISNINWKSNINFVAIQAQNIWIRTIAEKHRVLLKGNCSWIETNNFASVVPSLRFFYSKDYEIRGCKCKFLSSRYKPEHSANIGTKLITGTVEYQYNFVNKWWSSVFIDIGEVTNDIKWNNFKSGVGIGIHYQLPVGPIKLNIATPLVDANRINNKLLYFYINLGSEL